MYCVSAATHCHTDPEIAALHIITPTLRPGW